MYLDSHESRESRHDSHESICLIPAFKPSANLINLAQNLIDKNFTVIVINDGSPCAFDDIFHALDSRVIILKNAINLGKGAALKLGINFALNSFPCAKILITLDCDGQHKVSDALKLNKAFLNANADLAIGTREFGGKIPLRSKLGNRLTHSLFKAMFGKNIKDTQSGLRAFSPHFARNLLKIPYNGYEFEMQMLILACQNGAKILQMPIATIYIDNNKSSHFNPIFDSLSIYFVLFRHIFNSALTALIDYVVFVVAFSLSFGLFSCMLSGRIVAGSVNFIIGKRFVFKTRANLAYEITTYALLTIILMLISLQGITLISSYFQIS